MRTLLWRTAGTILYLGIPQGLPLCAQSIDSTIPIRPHEAESGKLPEIDDPAPTFRTRSLVGAVPASQLAHKPPKAARTEFERGMRSWRKGQRTEAIGHFAAAVDVDPNYGEAYASLGQLCLETGEPSRALEHLERALAIYPDSDALQGNKAFALLMLRHPAEAEQAARRAVGLAPRSVTAHYLLGLALLQQSRATAETARELELAAAKYPDAWQGLAWVRERLASAKAAEQPPR